MKKLFICFSLVCILNSISGMTAFFHLRGWANLIVMIVILVGAFLVVINGYLLLNYIKSNRGESGSKLKSKITSFLISLFVFFVYSVFLSDWEEILHLRYLLRENTWLLATGIHLTLTYFIFLIILYFIGILLFYRTKDSGNQQKTD